MGGDEVGQGVGVQQRDVADVTTTRAYCDFLLALTYCGYPAQITAIWALERTYLESWDGARPGSIPYTAKPLR